MVPGNRVLLRAANNPMMVAAYLAVIKAGGVVVATMPLLRARELATPITKAKISARAVRRAARRRDGEDAAARARPRRASSIGATTRGSLETLMAKPGYENFTACDTASDDVCLIALHLRHHRRAEGHDAFPPRHAGDLRHLRASTCCRPSRDDLFIGSPPLAFTFGLGGHRAVPAADRRRDDPARAGAARTSCCRRSRNTAPRSASPRRPPIARCWRKLAEHDISSLRKCVSAGEALPKATFEAWHAGDRHADHRRHRRDRDAAHLHRRARRARSAPARPAAPCPATRRRSSTTTAARCRPAPSAALRCGDRPAAAISPTRARRKYVQDGWNVTGDTYLMDADGYFWYQARSDDMIISAGYNIAGPGGRSRAADASGGRRMRRRRRAGRGARADREGLCGAARRDTPAMPRLTQDACRTT